MQRIAKVLTLSLFTAATIQLHAATTTLTGTVRDFVSTSAQGAAQSPAVTYNNDFENACCGDDHNITTSTLVGGKPVYNGSGSWSTHGATQFNQWFNNTPGVNVSIPYSITLDDSSNPGTFTYSNGNFFPIDGQGFGNYGSHNYSFTYEIDTTFNYSGSGSFTFTGDDDVFVYINNQKVIDLGGVHGAESKSVNLTTLGLTAGQNYNLDVFFAERHTSASSFRMDTTLALQTRPAPDGGSSALLVAGASALLMAVRRHKKN